MDSQRFTQRRSWPEKFRNAARGVGLAARGQSSFTVHLGFAVAVVLASWWLEISRVEWCLVVLCIAMVLAAETMNSALERIARLIDRSHNPELGAALDMASGAVLLAAAGAVAVGLAIFLPRLGALWGSYG